jgi:hypothetical protein
MVHRRRRRILCFVTVGMYIHTRCRPLNNTYTSINAELTKSDIISLVLVNPKFVIYLHTYLHTYVDKYLYVCTYTVHCTARSWLIANESFVFRAFYKSGISISRLVQQRSTNWKVFTCQWHFLRFNWRYNFFFSTWSASSDGLEVGSLKKLKKKLSCL